MPAGTRVEVDVCPEHGSFFERFELKAVHNAIAFLRAQHAEQEAAQERIEQYASNHDNKAFGALDALLLLVD